MTWTRLFYIKNMQQAIQRVIPGQVRQELPISTRYQAEVRKQFRIYGVPWIYELKQPKLNARHRKPKVSKRSIAKVQRILKIQKNLAVADQKILQYRQEKLNNRKLGGIDKIFAKGLPSYIKDGAQALPDYLKNKKQKKTNE